MGELCRFLFSETTCTVSFSEDLFLLILDKLLIGIIILIVGFTFQRTINAHRAKLELKKEINKNRSEKFIEILSLLSFCNGKALSLIYFNAQLHDTISEAEELSDDYIKTIGKFELSKIESNREELNKKIKIIMQELSESSKVFENEILENSYWLYSEDIFPTIRANYVAVKEFVSAQISLSHQEAEYVKNYYEQLSSVNRKVIESTWAEICDEYKKLL